MTTQSTSKQVRLSMLVQAGLLAGPFLSMIDSNAVNVAIPNIARSLGDSLDNVQWVVSGYLLAMAAGLGVSAYITRRFGTTRAYTVSLGGFTAASVACAFAGSTNALIAARVVQGIFGSSMVPLAMSMLLGAGGARRQISPAAGVLLFLAPALGPTLGGLLTTHYGWQSIFLINLPFGVVGVLGILGVPTGLVPGRDLTARFDAIGVVTLAGGLLLSTYGASEGPRSGWLAGQVWPLWAGGVALLLTYALWGAVHEDPAVRLDFLRARDPSLAVSISVIASLVLFAVLFLMPVYVQEVQGLSAFEAGLMLLPQGIVMAIGTVLGSALTERKLVRSSVIVGAVILTLATAALILVEASTPAWATALALCGRGLALGLIIQPLLVATLGQLSQTKLADANALFNIVERVAGSFGVALVATFYQTRVQYHVAELTGLPPARSLIPDAATAGFHDTVVLLVGLGAVGSFIALFLGRRVDAKVGVADRKPSDETLPAALSVEEGGAP